MLQELKPNEYDKVRSLFKGFDYSLSVYAAIERNNPGRIFVDNVERPRTALALTVEGYLLAGDDNNPATNEALHQLFKEQIFTGKVFIDADSCMCLAVHPETWEAKLPELIPTHEADKIPRYHYLCRGAFCAGKQTNLEVIRLSNRLLANTKQKVKYKWRDHLPEGYTVHRIDHKLLILRILNTPLLTKQLLRIQPRKHE